MPLRLSLLVGVAFVALSAWGQQAVVRVDQVGYEPDGPKVAVLMSGVDAQGAAFRVVDADGKTVRSGRVGASAGAWNKAYGYCHGIDLGEALLPRGTYGVVVEGRVTATSPSFAVAPLAEQNGPLVDNAAKFFAAQHAVHRHDAAATVYETPTFSDTSLKGALKPVAGGQSVDLSGGWYDAGDYLKFVETASYADAALLLAAREGAGLPMTAEARYGLDWLLKTWDADSRTLYYQVGVGDGNAKVRGDHDAWRLPAADDALNVPATAADWFLQHRPAFRTGPSVSPNLAGRLAAAFALGEQVFAATDPALAAKCDRAARSIYAAAQTDHVKRLLTTSPHGYYPESEWRDDMEWGAAELFLATGERAFLRDAARWAKAYLGGGHEEVLNLYDVGALAHWELARAMSKAGAVEGLEVTRADLVAALDQQLKAAAARSAKEPFGLGVPYDSGDVVPHVIGLAVTACLHGQLTGEGTYRPLACAQRRWIFGGNPWGVSFIVGAGTVYPRCLHHQVANLTGVELAGAVVDGPADEKEVAEALKELPDGSRRCPPGKADPYVAFTGHGLRFVDDVAAHPCVEPAIDYAALVPLWLALSAVH